LSEKIASTHTIAEGIGELLMYEASYEKDLRAGLGSFVGIDGEKLPAIREKCARFSTSREE